MAILSTTFAAFFIIALILFHLRDAPAWRRGALAVTNLVFLLSQAAYWGAAPLLAFILLGYGGVWIVRRSRSRSMLIAAIAVIVAVFLYLKRYSIIQGLPPLPLAYAVVGISYLLFRIIHLLVDTAEGAIAEKINLLDYFNYTCFFLGLLSGPIQRYQEFLTMYRRPFLPNLSSEQAYAAFSRIINGLLKIVLISALLLKFQQMIMMKFSQYAAHPLSWMALSLGCIGYLYYLYMNFSGYMDVVIGLGRFLGFTLPENFNRPLDATSFLDLWMRWHITLSEWFKIYLFNPLVKAAKYQWSNPRATIPIGVAAYFITFFIMGCWHGATLIFMIYGIMLGLGAGVNKLYEELLRKRLGKQVFQHLRHHPAHRILSNGLTIGFFAIALMCLWNTMDQVKLYLSLLGPMRLCCVLPGCVIVFLLLKLPWELVARFLSSMPRVAGSAVAYLIARQLGLGLRAFCLCIVFATNSTNLPDFVYKAF